MINLERMPIGYRRMKYKVISWVLVLTSIGTCTWAEPAPVPAAPEFEASSYVLMEHVSGSVLAQHNPRKRVEPASLTKIMTAYIVYKALSRGDVHLDDEVSISERAWRSVGSRMFIEVGDRVPLVDLLRGMVIQSGNDASIALAEHLAGTEESFADLMNAQAEQLGLEDSNFVNSTGLPSKDHYTTAYDVALLSRAMIQEFPEEYRRYAQKEFTFNNIRQHNRNRLLWRDDSVDGIKTGYTAAARYCLAASAARKGMRLISVVMGAGSPRSRMVNSQALLNYGFRYYEVHQLYHAREVLVERRMWNGESKSLQLGLDHDLFVTIPRGQSNSLKAVVHVEPDIMAPVSEGDKLGTVKVTFGDEDVAEKPLVALGSNPEGNLWRRLFDFFVLLY